MGCTNLAVALDTCQRDPVGGEGSDAPTLVPYILGSDIISPCDWLFLWFTSPIKQVPDRG